MGFHSRCQLALNGFKLFQKKQNFLLSLVGISVPVVKMSRRRFFKNNLEDYKGGTVLIQETAIKHQIREFVDDILVQQAANYRNCSGGLYVGDAGIAYMMYYLIKENVFPEKKEELFDQAIGYVHSSNTYIKKKNKENDPAFLLGSSGVHAVTAALFYLHKDFKSQAKDSLKKFVEAADTVRLSAVDEVLVGRAGYLSGAFWLTKQFPHDIMQEKKLHEICDAIVASGRKYSNQKKSPCPLMYSYHGTEYLGAAHGLSAILQMLLTAPNYLDTNPEAMKDVKCSIDYLLSLQTPSGNFPCSLDEIGNQREDELVHWCHGGPGVVYLMAKSYLKFKEQKYLESCLKCGELVWNKGLLLKGPGICHGVAGNGYVFLLLYRLTHDHKHLHRALKMAEFMRSEEFMAKARTPDSPYSLYEGTAGTVCFLVDLMKADKAAFPFLDVF